MGATDTLGFVEGQTLSGSFVFENSTQDVDPDSDRAFYPNSLLSFSFGHISSIPVDPTDYSYFNVGATTSSFVSAYLNTLSGNVSDIFEFGLLASGNPNVIGNDQIDLTTLDLSDFDVYDNSSFSFQHTVYYSATEHPITIFKAELQSLDVTVIPEPTTIVLMSCGLLGLLGIAIRRRKRK